MNATEYRIENEKLLTEYEDRVRKWLAVNYNSEIAQKIPYMRDGVVCPEAWFEDANDFRPLIVLKEVSLGINEVSELDSFMNLWGQQKHFEFVENPFDDVQIGTFSQWQRIARLLKGLEEIHNGASACDYYKYNFGFVPGGERYAGSIEGYVKYNNEQTANAIYNGIVKKMALMEIKKVGAGQIVGSNLSKQTGYYTEHIEPFKDLLCRQIELINPTVVICCGRENGCISNLLGYIKENTKERLWIDGYHHTRSSNLHFYEEPLNVYRAYRNNEK